MMTTRIPSISEGAEDNASKNAFALGIVVLVSITALCLGIFVVQQQFPFGDIDHNIKTSAIFKYTGAFFGFTLVGALVCGAGSIALIFFRIGMYPEEWMSVKTLRWALLFIGVAVAAYGAGYLAGATAVQTHNAFAENSEAYTPSRWAYLQDVLDLHKREGIGVACIGGFIAAGGISVRVAEKICSMGAWIHATFKALAAGKRLEQEKEGLIEHLEK